MIKVISIYYGKYVKYILVPFREVILFRLPSFLSSYLCFHTTLIMCLLIVCIEQNFFANLIILVNWEETNPKIVDIWFIDVVLMNIQLLGTLKSYLKLLTLPVNKQCQQWSLGSWLWQVALTWSAPSTKTARGQSVGF